jgi:hypothetical protein
MPFVELTDIPWGRPVAVQVAGRPAELAAAIAAEAGIRIRVLRLPG